MALAGLDAATAEQLREQTRCPISLRVCYAVSGTVMAYGALSPYAYATPYPAPTPGVTFGDVRSARYFQNALLTSLRACYAMPGTDLAHILEGNAAAGIFCSPLLQACAGTVSAIAYTLPGPGTDGDHSSVLSPLPPVLISVPSPLSSYALSGSGIGPMLVPSLLSPTQLSSTDVGYAATTLTCPAMLVPGSIIALDLAICGDDATKVGYLPTAVLLGKTPSQLNMGSAHYECVGVL
eukprot:3897005-Rhodomonas_salina.2